MSRKTPLSVLVVGSTPKATDYLRTLLTDDGFSPVTVVSSSGEAKRQQVDNPADIVVINTPLPDELGVQLALDLGEGDTCGVLLIVRSDLYEQVTDKVEDSGILVLQRPSTGQAIRQAMHLLAVMYTRLRSMQRRASTLQDKMEEIRLVNRAKLLLMERLGMSEAEAHRYIEKQAMDTCVRRREVAENLIRTYGD